MLDIKLIRESPDFVRDKLKRRQNPEILEWLDNVIKKDKEYRELLQKVESLRHKRNVISNEIRILKKEGKNADSKIKESKENVKKIKETEEELGKIKEEIKYFLMRIPNLPHDSVPDGKDESENKVIKKWGTPRKFSFPVKNHAELAEALGVADFERSAKISGSMFYFLKGELALLNLALIRFAVDFLIKKGYTYVEPPLMIRKKVVEGVTDYDFFREMVYKVDGEDLHLIPTAEHPIAGMHMNEVIKEDELPLKYVGYSMCFRKELGSHGVDTKGLWRTHQFNKVEQFILCKPEDSYKYYDELLSNTEHLFQKLGIPYRIFESCAGDLGIVKSKGCDLEGWFPRQKAYGELASLSNCTDYQARRLNIRMEDTHGNRRFLHTLNNTAIATSRAIVAILENYQNEDGSVTIPKVLVPYMNGIKKIEKREDKE
ncbi:serine--tRNA ligase [Candidatus Woesearchaeota archaeon]|nr:MAG: serine--tRNA ligase [Candidatus Woesearchaeota archaeon]